MVPAVGKKIASLPARQTPAKKQGAKAEPRTARVIAASVGAKAAASRPLSADAFDRRFVAPLAASPLPQPQRFASRLLESPQADDIRSTFTVRVADAAGAMNAAHAFHLPEAVVAAAPPAPETAEGNTVLAYATPDELPRILNSLPPELEVEPTPAPKRQPNATAKPDPRSAGKLRKPAPAIGMDDDAAGAKPALRPGRSAKAPTVVAALPAKPNKPKSLWQALGFAKPDNPDEDRPGRNIPWPGGGRKIAYYDISAQKVYMPNGESMEAHSGQGKWRDNPAYAHMKMIGPTPPSTYKLSMRESLFHGVQALRLTPVNGVNPHGRVGLLTHSYLRRRPGDSAGCIAFKDYPRFLAAYKRGQVDQVVVVSSMNKAKVLTAKVASAATSFVSNR